MCIWRVHSCESDIAICWCCCLFRGINSLQPPGVTHIISSKTTIRCSFSHGDAWERELCFHPPLILPLWEKCLCYSCIGDGIGIGYLSPHSSLPFLLLSLFRFAIRSNLQPPIGVSSTKQNQNNTKGTPPKRMRFLSRVFFILLAQDYLGSIWSHWKCAS